MEINKRLLGRSAIQNKNSASPSVDVGGILLRLLLFESYILNSIRLCEIPKLVERLGFEPTMTLLKSGALAIYLDAITTGETGRTTVLHSRKIKGALPFGAYCFQTVTMPNRKEYVSGCFKDWINSIPIGKREIQKLKYAILSVGVEAPKSIGPETIAGLKSDLFGGGKLIAKAVVKVAKEKTGKQINPMDLQLNVRPIDESDIAAETNLGILVSADDKEVHEIIQRAFLDIAGLNQRIAEMKAFNALSGFRYNDLSLFEEKISFIIQNFDPDCRLDQGNRVFNLLGLPDFRDVGIKYKLDIEKFFKLRESSECKEFRIWLNSVHQYSDAEIQKRVSCLNARIASAVNSGVGKTLRFLVTNGIGQIPIIGNALGPVVSAIDTFILDKFFKKSGIVTFVGKMYPALFRESNS